MVLHLITLAGAVAGLHSACWGAYRDSPYESFSYLKFARSIIAAVAIALLLFNILPYYGIVETNLGMLLVFFMGFERVFTEFLKVFLREENEKKYKIPMRFSYFGKIVKNRLKRIIIGIGFLGGSAVLLHMLATFPLQQSFQMGVLVAFLAGLGIAIAGVWRAAPFEGFQWKKFLKSPIAGAMSGFILVPFTAHYSLMFFTSIGMIHMILQLVKIVSIHVVGESAPSKFGEDKKPKFKGFLKSRTIILLPYAFTWIFFIAILLD